MRRALCAFSLMLGAASVFAGHAYAEELHPSYESLIEAVAVCGVPKAQIKITYEDELQSEIVRIGDLGGSDEARFQCLRKATFSGYFVDVSAAPQREAYEQFSRREDDLLLKTRARDWLKAARLFDRVPRFDPRKGPRRFARAVETACSVRKGSALEVIGATGLTFRTGFIMNLMDLKTSDQFKCIMHMVTASDSDEHDVHLGFVGNEAYQTENPK